MLTSLFQTEQSVNSLFFSLYIWMISLEWILNCLLFSAFPYRREEADLFFFFSSSRFLGGGRGTEREKLLI